MSSTSIKELEHTALPVHHQPDAISCGKRRSVFSVILVIISFVLLFVKTCGICSPARDLGLLEHKAEDWRLFPVGTIKWSACDDPGSLEGSECGFIIVPTDYLNPDAGVTKVALGRYNATRHPRRGMVLFNFGGPGGSGTSRITQAPSYQAAIIGEDYDWIAFDPRGIGKTEPKMQCFPPKGYGSFRRNTVLHQGFDVLGNLSDPRTRLNLLKQQTEMDSLLETQFEVCKQTLGDALSYMGTTLVSRDIDFITRTLEGENTLINYYGFSYGTILGQYLVNMFPDRIGRVVIDGVADAVAWANNPPYTWYDSWLEFTEGTYGLFMDLCSRAGPESCDLAKYKGEPPTDINNRIEAFFDSLYRKPMAVPAATSPGILTNGAARSTVFISLQRPTTWQSISSALASAMAGNGTALLNYHLAMMPFTGDLQRSGVTCNDVKPFQPPSSEEVVDISLKTLKNVTRFAKSAVVTEPDSGCQFWQGKTPEAWRGPWNETLRNVLLIHSNLLDPVTPLTSGQKVKELLGNSARLALRVGPGHCSISLPSLCTSRINLAFFANGTLPSENHLCSVDSSPFPGVPIEDSEMIPLDNNNEDQKLLEHLSILAKEI